MEVCFGRFSEAANLWFWDYAPTRGEGSFAITTFGKNQSVVSLFTWFRLLTWFTLLIRLTLLTLFTIFKLLYTAWLVACMPTYIERLERYWNGLRRFWAKSGGMGYWMGDTPRTVMTTRASALVKRHQMMLFTESQILIFISWLHQWGLELIFIHTQVASHMLWERLSPPVEGKLENTKTFWCCCSQDLGTKNGNINQDMSSKNRDIESPVLVCSPHIGPHFVDGATDDR